MNHYLATYVDLIQSIGFASIFFLFFILIRKFLLDTKKDNYIDAVKIKVDE